MGRRVVKKYQILCDVIYGQPQIRKINRNIAERERELAWKQGPPRQSTLNHLSTNPFSYAKRTNSVTKKASRAGLLNQRLLARVYTISHKQCHLLKTNCRSCDFGILPSHNITT